MTLKFEITLAEAELIVGALRKLPMDQVEAIVNKLRAQATPQITEEAPKEEEKKQKGK